jgi:predicted secreted Zn-dependent protease
MFNYNSLQYQKIAVNLKTHIPIPWINLEKEATKNEIPVEEHYNQKEHERHHYQVAYQHSCQLS